ncbi:MAG: DUF6804 family protein [Pedobacter sp.]|jgi:hypothetical protein
MKSIIVGYGILLLLAIPTFWPYSFYLLLRLVIFIVLLYIAIFHKPMVHGLVLVFAAIGMLFDPLAPVFLIKQSLVSIHLISSILIFIAVSPLKINVKA